MNEMQPIELTLPAQTLYSSSRRNIMPAVDQVNRESGVPTRGENRSNRAPERTREPYRARPTTAEGLIEGLAGGHVRAPERAMVDQPEAPVEDARKGIAVREFRERFADAEEHASQKINAELDDEARVKAAGDLLRIDFKDPKNKTQRDALLEAHYAKDPFKKVKALRNGKFTPEQRGLLIESHLAGMKPDTKAGVDPIHDANIRQKIAEIAAITFTDPVLAKYAERIGELYDADIIDRGMLVDFYNEVRKQAVEGGALANIGEAKNLQEKIAEIVAFDDLRTEKGDPRGRDYSTEEAKNEDFKARINAETDPNRKKELEDQRKAFVRGLASSINLQGGGQYDDLFKIIIDEGNSLEYLVNRIVSAPLDSESGDWQLGFYGQNNLDSITNILRTQKDNLIVPNDPDGTKTTKLRTQRNIEYQSALEIEESIRLAHEINKAIVNADLSTFQRIAGSLSDEKLSRLSKIKGVGVVGRLLEAEHGSLVAKDTWINSNNYAKMMGKDKDPETGLLSADQSASALESFRELVRKAKEKADDPSASDELKAELKELTDLDDWQVDLGFNVGRAMYNLSLRAAEWISQGKVPKGDKGIVSYPQEQIARILNWPQMMLQKFDVAESRGGVEFLNNALRIYQATRKSDGYGEMGLEKIGGNKVENFEMPDMTGSRGWWASWRGRQLMMETVPIQFRRSGGIGPFGGLKRVEREGKEIKADGITDLGVLLDFSAITINGTEFKQLPDSDKADFLKSIFLDEKGSIRADFKRGLGAALFYGLKPSTSGHHPDSQEYLDVKENIRRKIWEKAAEENPLGVIPFLHGLEYKNGEKVKIMPDRGASKAEQEKWQSFSRKLFQLNEIKMQRIKRWDAYLKSDDTSVRNHAVEEIKKVTLESIIAEEEHRNVPEDQKITLKPDEIKLLDRIRDEGRKAAPHLANIRFAHMPFMNDLSLEKIDYGIVGAEAYRRMLNDTGGFQGANEALIKLMNNPSKFKEPEEIFETIMPFIEGVGGILSTSEGQKKGYIWIEGVLDMFERGANTPTHKIKVPDIGPIKFKPIELKTLAFVERKFRQFPLVNEILRFTRQANSKAQNTAGPDASVWDNQKLFKASEEALHAGVMSEEEIKKFRKRFGNRLWMQFKMFLRAAFGGTAVGVLDLVGREPKDLKM